jgi:acetoin utilization deacetylase AcuC-like enzyme
MYAFQRVIMPIALEFNPDLVIVSAGFDAAAGDSLGGCFVTPAGYAHMTHMLMCLADGKIVVCLEVSFFINYYWMTANLTACLGWIQSSVNFKFCIGCYEGLNGRTTREAS